MKVTMKRSPTLDRGSFLWSASAAACAMLPLALLLPLWLPLLSAALLAAGVVLGLRGRALPGVLRWAVTLTLAGLILWHYGVVFGSAFGRDTGAALLTAMLAMKVLELRTVRDARILNSFALFAVIAAFLQDRGPLTLGLALLATIAALAALQRIAERETPRQTPGRAVGWQSRLGFISKMVAFALPLAIAAFFLFPRLSTPLWGLPGNSAEARTGLSDSMAPGDIAQLYIDDSPMLRVTFDGPIPPNPLLYWRGPVLASFDGRRWTRSGWAAALPPGDLIERGAVIEYELQQEPSERHFVFALDMPLEAPGDARIALDRTVLSRRPLNEISRHRLRAVTDYHYEPTLVRTLAMEMIRLPDGFNPRTLALARQWREQAGDDDRLVIQQALALFNAQFRYTLEPDLLGRHSVDEFLFETRAGYCEHFASAFAVLMRAAGIPTRVVTGYQGGNFNPIGQYLVVRQSDAHAWNEVWLDGLGWIRIDPTNAVAPERIQQGTDAFGGRGQHRSRMGQSLLDAADWMRRSWNQFVLGYDASRQQQLLLPLGIDARDWRQLALALAVGVALAMAITLALLLRRPPSSTDPLLRAWHGFVARLARVGARKAAHEGPLTFSQRAATELPHAAAEILALSDRYVRQRYAERNLDRDNEMKGLCADLRRFRITREPK
jgi:protein-glutamine gamma-glutamyltransferase